MDSAKFDERCREIKKKKDDNGQTKVTTDFIQRY